MKVSIIYGKRHNPLMILSPLICLVNKTPFSHTAVLLEDESGQWVYESTMPVSHKIPYSKWIEHYKLINQHDQTWRIKHAVLIKPYLNSMLGIKYSFYQLFMAGMSLIFQGLFKPKKSNGSRRLICAEFVILFLKRVCDVQSTKPDDYITLSDVFELSK